jgi:hypothetical protein
LAATLAASLAGACGGSSEGDGGGGSSAAGGGGGVGGVPYNPQSSGMPCDVATLIGDQCVSCHSDPPIQGVPMSLTSLDALKAPAPTDPTQTVAEMSVQRMNDPLYPMPPTGQLAADQIQIFSDWVAGGMQAGDCASGTGGTGGGVSYTPTCTSDQQWLYGDSESPMMHPGRACIDCHNQHFNAPHLTIAGTVYPSAHDTDDCFGQGQAIVEVHDAAGMTYSMTTNSAGNFYRKAGVTFPITAIVKYNGKEKAMKDPVDTGDCNSCHTEAGANGAPGRITLP